MDLKTYIQTARGNATALAADLEIPLTYLSQMARGDRSVTPERASQIEIATGKRVRRWDVRPSDWHLIWPELINRPGAPTVPEKKAVA